MEGGVINTGEVASAGRLVLLRAKGEGVHVDTLIGVAGVGLVRLDPREVGTFTLREAILAVKLELSGDDGVLAPAVKIKGGLSEDEGAGIGNCGSIIVIRVSRGIKFARTLVRTGCSKRRRRLNGVRVVRVVDVGGVVARLLNTSKVGLKVRVRRTIPVAREVGRNVGIKSTGVLEETTGINESIGVGSNLLRSTESMDGVRKSVDGISVVEGLGTKNLEKSGIASQGRAVVNVLIGLDDPDKLLNGVVKVKLDLVAGRTNRLITSELELSDQVLVRVLGHSAAFVSVKEDVVDVKGSSNNGLIVSNSSRNRAASSVLVSNIDRRTRIAGKSGDSPQALINRTDVKVDLDLVVLKSNQRKGKTRVGAKPELKRNVKGCLRKSVTRSANLTRSQGVARTIDVSEGRISDEGKLCGVTNHLEVSALLLGSHGKLVPDVHPITILAINALATNLDLNLSDELLAGEI